MVEITYYIKEERKDSFFYEAGKYCIQCGHKGIWAAREEETFYLCVECCGAFVIGATNLLDKERFAIAAAIREWSSQS